MCFAHLIAVWTSDDYFVEAAGVAANFVETAGNDAASKTSHVAAAVAAADTSSHDNAMDEDIDVCAVAAEVS